MKSHATKSQRGFTVIELLIVIAIIVTATLVIVNRVGAARQSSKVQSEADNMQAIVATTQTAFAGRADYSGLTTAYLVSMGGFPASMMNSGNPKNTWGGDVTVAGAGNVAKITYTDVPSQVCIQFVNSIAPSFKTVTIRGALVKDASSTTVALQTNDLTTTQTNCGTTPAAIDVTF
jgi:prepilin-type N-terminal cleavage/methylation domain-containing protein